MFNNIFYFLIPKKNRRKVEAVVKDMCRFIRQLNDRRYHIINYLEGTRGNCDYVDDYLIVNITLTLHNSEFYIHTSYDKRFFHRFFSDDKFSFANVGTGNSLRLFFYILLKRMYMNKNRDFSKHLLDACHIVSTVYLHDCAFSFVVSDCLDSDECGCKISDGYYLVVRHSSYNSFETDIRFNKSADEFLNYLNFLSVSFNPFYSEIVKLIDKQMLKRGKFDFCDLLNKGI